MTDDIQRQFDDNRREHIELMNEVKDIKKDISSINTNIAKLPKYLSEEFDKRYASKDTEVAVKTFVKLGMTAIIGGLLSLIFIK